MNLCLILCHRHLRTLESGMAHILNGNCKQPEYVTQVFCQALRSSVSLHGLEVQTMVCSECTQYNGACACPIHNSLRSAASYVFKYEYVSFLFIRRKIRLHFKNHFVGNTLIITLEDELLMFQERSWSSAEIYLRRIQDLFISYRSILMAVL